MRLDRDLARLYQVKPIALRQQVHRHPRRFPPDFLFELSEEEAALLLSQNVIPSRRSLGGPKPLAFTEQGIAMLSSVLTSKRAIKVKIAIMLGEQHVREDLGRIPSFQNWIAELPIRAWMYGQRLTVKNEL